MEFRAGQTSNNNGGQTQQPSSAPRMSAPNMGANKMNMGGDKKKLWVTVAIVVVVVVILGGAGWWGWSALRSGGLSGLNTGEYQAVFLTNGQVYFGKLSAQSEKNVDLTDIYYLQVQQSVQPTQNNNNGQNPQVSLAKLGNELHGPEDHMYINRDQILFWENLKDSGKVVQAIKQNQQQK